LDCRFQIVIDENRENACEKGKSVYVRVQKYLLPLAGIETYKVFAGIFAAHAEKLQPRLFPEITAMAVPQSASAS